MRPGGNDRESEPFAALVRGYMRQKACPSAAMQDPRSAVVDRYRTVRAATERLAEPLSGEDQTIQSMADASPTKWHRAHTTWFFETFLLAAHQPGYRAFDPRFGFLFNSYYEAVGPRHARPARGLLSRPSIDEVRRFRGHVDAAMEDLLERASEATWAEIEPLVELGINHEQQHQELLLTDIKHGFWCNPIRPAYRPQAADAGAASDAKALGWLDIPGGIYEIGHRAGGFCFDNEQPVHRTLLRPYRLADRPVSVGEYLAFMADDGYQRPEFWLSDGWAMVQAEGWRAPFYWEWHDGAWQSFTLAGMRPVMPAEPVCHLSYFEAAAFAAWTGKRLPTEFEYEVAAQLHDGTGRAARAGLRSDILHPAPMTDAHRRPFDQDVWEWTGSAYAPYPGYRAAAGAIGEYNGKFMCSQMVLRGRSCATPAGHDRASYRNFFPPTARWQFSGLRLAEDV